MSLRDFLLDPVAVKEVSGLSRRWQTFAGRCVYVVLIGVIVWIFWRKFDRDQVFPTLSDYARLGRDLFHGFFLLQLLIGTLAGISAASDMVTKECRAGTLGVLACTPLSSLRIAVGKWKGAMAQTSTTLLCGAPILAICVFLGGATAWDLAYSFTLSVAAAALGAALSLYFSSVFRSGVTALLVSVAVLGAWTILPGTFIDPPSNPSLGTYLICALHPAYAAEVAINPRLGPGFGSVLAYAWVSASLASALLVWALLRRTAGRLETLVVRSPGPPLLTRAFEALDRFYEGIGSERIRNIRFFDSRGAVWQTRAMMWKELRVRSTGKFRNAVRIALALLLLLVNSVWLPLEYLRFMIWIPAAVLLVQALANGASLFVKEKEERKWDILLATPISSDEILHAKLVAGLVPTLPVLGLTLLFWAGISWACRIGALDLVMMAAVTLLPALLGYVIAALSSLHARSLRGATTAAFGAMLAILVGLPVLIALGPESNFVQACVNPFPYFDRLGETLHWWGASLGFRMEPLFEPLLLFGFLYGTAIVVGLLVMNARFDPVSGRS